jgi:hypothetical protein
MLAFLIELIILVAVLLCVHREQRALVFLSGVVVIITPVWILLAAVPICSVGFVIHKLLRLRRKTRLASAVLDRQLTVEQWRSL